MALSCEQLKSEHANSGAVAACIVQPGNRGGNTRDLKWLQSAGWRFNWIALRISYRRGPLIRCLSIKGGASPTAKLSGPFRRTLPASCPLQCRIRHECRQSAGWRFNWIALRISYRRGPLIRCLSIKGGASPTAKLSGPLRRTLPASCPLQCRIRHECRHRLPNRGIVGALQLVLPRQQEIDHLLTEFDLDRPQPQPPAFPRFANAFSCRSSRRSHRL